MHAQSGALGACLELGSRETAARETACCLWGVQASLLSLKLCSRLACRDLQCEQAAPEAELHHPGAEPGHCSAQRRPRQSASQPAGLPLPAALGSGVESRTCSAGKTSMASASEAPALQ